MQTVRKAINGTKFIGFEEITTSVSCSTFSNGVKIYVNNSSVDAVLSGSTIPAYGFLMEDKYEKE